MLNMRSSECDKVAHLLLMSYVTPGTCNGHRAFQFASEVNIELCLR